MFTDSKPSGLTRKLVRSLSTNDDLTKLSRYVTKNIEKLTIPIIFLQQQEDESYATIMKLYHLLTCEKQMMVYPPSFDER
jgi:hypothetical protein